MKNTQSINVLGGNENLLRTYEICLSGGLKLFIQYDKEEITERQLKAIQERISDVITDSIDNADVLVEITRPEFSQIINDRIESVENIEKRANKYKITLKEETISAASIQLLKVGYDRLNLQPYDIELIIRIAKVIANMDLSENIEVQHIAEALQYRANCKKDKNQ